MAKALELVKNDLGNDAVILHTRTFRRGGILGVGSRQVVEITAASDVNIVPPNLRKRRVTRQKNNRLQTTETPAARDIIKRTYNVGYEEGKASVDKQTPPPSPSPSPSLSAPSSHPQNNHMPNTQQTDAQLNNEITQIREMVQCMMKKQATHPRPDLPDKLFDQYLALLEQEVTEELADEVVDAVKQSLGDTQLDNDNEMRKAISKAIATLIPIDKTPSISQKNKDGRPFTIALIGPTGVGKTTTIAKLAATFKLREKLKVALITIDTYRIAAVDQLRTYANIIDLPLHVVLTPLELREALDKCQSYDVILIDTAGRSQRDDDKLDQLKAFVDAADPHEVHLVLSSTCSQQVMFQTVDRFSEIRTDRIIFTKLDEAVSFGVLLNVIRRVNKQLSYITTGQEVPHQIEPGSRERLAELIMGESL